ncbi:MAG: YeeE/YedE family protein [Gammaproteobacteria bacterium HGW-Gammaproteobacteria-3]|nr:MAG: YeeE/YedE family protein [Gammaproteobacteria bacterium HGW-Gammaproteobacteria-3]
MENFTPYSALIGGVLIGLAGGILLLFNRRNAGISGIASGVLLFKGGDVGWRLCFLAGLIAAPLLYRWLGGNSAIAVESAPIKMALAGVLVGFGTRLGGGCTSGHGVCGLARGSLRSLVATLTFMVVAALTVYWVRHG